MIAGLASPATDSARGFRTLMQAMARPGTLHDLRLVDPPAPLGAAQASVLLLLADPSTALHLAGPADHAPVRDWTRFHTGAPLTPAPEAQLALGRWRDLLPLDRFDMGLPDYPDRSATLIVELDRLEADGARLTGPGIRDHTRLSLPETAPFGINRALFPMGLDFIFTCGDRLACLPRSTVVEDI